MKKRILSIILSACMVVSLFPAMTFAADKNEDSSVKVDHGAYIITQTDNTVTVKIDPAKGYALSKLRLINKHGVRIKFKKSAKAEYQTYIKGDLEDYKVVCKYRQATMKNKVNELAMRTGEKNKFFKAHIEYVEGSANTRKKVLDKTVIYTSSNPDVVQVDEKGKLTALKPGYSRITATAEAGDNVESFGYVIVDGDKVTKSNPKLGTIQLFVYFSFDDLKAMADVGHSLMVFRADKKTTINTAGMFSCYKFTKEFYEQLKAYDGTGANPATHYAVKRKANESDEAYSKRCKKRADKLIKKLKKTPKKFTVYPGEIVTFGNTSGNDDDIAMLGGDFIGLLERHNLSNLLYENISEESIQKINPKDVLGLVMELAYDLSTGYNPFNGYTDDGKVHSGVSVNYESYRQISYRDMSSNVCISTDVNKIQLDAMLDYAQYKNHFNLLGRNCTLAAVNEWNIVAASSPRLKVSYDYGGITKGFALPLFTQINIATKSLYLKDGEAVIEYNIPAFYGQKNSK